MKFIDSLYKDFHNYNNDKINNVLSHHNDSTNLIFFPFVNDGYMLNNVIKFLFTNNKEIKKFVLFDKNLFNILMYCSIYQYHNELIDALKLLEKTFNSSKNKESFHDLAITYLNCRLKFNTCINYGNNNLVNKIMSIDDISRRFKNYSDINYRTSMIDQECLDYSIESSHKQRLIHNKDLNSYVVTGGYDIAKMVKNYNKFDGYLIESLSSFYYVKCAALYMFLLYTSDSVKLYEKEYRVFQLLSTYNNTKELSFNELYSLINELYIYMSSYNFEMYCYDLKYAILSNMCKRIFHSTEYVTETFLDFYDYTNDNLYDYAVNLIVENICPEKDHLIRY